MRAYAKEFFENNMKFKDAQQGKYERQCVLSDEDLRSQASQWNRENVFKKGESNMTSAMFCEYVNNHLLPNHHLLPHFHAQSLFVLLFAGFINSVSNQLAIKKVFISMGMSEKTS